MVGLEAILKRADNRNSSGNSSLKQEIFLCSLGGFQNLFSVDCDQILVCSHHVLSGFQCCKNVSTGRLNSTDQLDHNINRRISFDICPVCCKNRWIFYFFRCFFEVTHQDLCDLYLTSKLGCHFLLLIFDNFIDSGSYCSKTKKGRIYDFFAHFLMSPFRFFHSFGVRLHFIQLSYHGSQTFQASILNLGNRIRAGGLKHRKKFSYQMCPFLFIHSINPFVKTPV